MKRSHRPVTVRDILDSTVQGRAILQDIRRHLPTVYASCPYRTPRTLLKAAVEAVLSQEVPAEIRKVTVSQSQKEDDPWDLVEHAMRHVEASHATVLGRDGEPVARFRAFQGLQDMAASSPLDAEQVRKDTDILASFHGVPREPWYKRLWNFLASPFRAASEFEDLVKGYQNAGIWGGTIPQGYSIQDARNIPIPYDRRQGTAIDLPEYKMLVKNSDIDRAFRDLLREPWYKRLWSWLRGTK